MLSFFITTACSTSFDGQTTVTRASLFTSCLCVPAGSAVNQTRKAILLLQRLWHERAVFQLSHVLKWWSIWTQNLKNSKCKKPSTILRIVYEEAHQYSYKVKLKTLKLLCQSTPTDRNLEIRHLVITVLKEQKLVVVALLCTWTLQRSSLSSMR